MASPVLELRNLHKYFGALTVTNDVSLNVMPGQLHALIGPNGAGKTTLIQQVYGALKPEQGSIHLDGQNITNLKTPARIRAGIGRSFQISNVLMDFTVLENSIIAEQARQRKTFQFFTPAFSDKKLIAGAKIILDRVGLADRAKQKVADLAHGERRMLELALATAASPSLLLLDEPMAGAGPEDSQRMTDIISELSKNIAVLLIEHDMDAVFKLADQITVLVAGSVIASGSSYEISRNDAVRAAYLGDDAA